MFREETRESTEELAREEWQITGDHQNDVSLCGGEGGMNAPKRTRAGSPIRLDSNPQCGIGRNGRLTGENANRLVVGLEELDKGFDQCPPGRFPGGE